jgi:hypothetical protein
MKNIKSMTVVQARDYVNNIVDYDDCACAETRLILGSLSMNFSVIPCSFGPQTVEQLPLQTKVLSFVTVDPFVISDMIIPVQTKQINFVDVPVIIDQKTLDVVTIDQVGFPQSTPYINSVQPTIIT